MRSIRLLSNTARPMETKRRYSVLLTLICSTAILFTILYTYSDEAWDDFQFPISPPIQMALHSNPESSYLWSYVTQSNRTAWDWLATQRREGYRRPSWGGLRAQGAKGHIRENLIEGKQYLTTFPAAGWNNEVMETCNLIAMALRSNRIPILSPFWPDNNHLHHQAPYLSVSEVFDLSELIARYDTPIVDIFELKVGPEVEDRHRSVVYDGEHPRSDAVVGQSIPAEEPQYDDLKCWNAHLTVQEDAGQYLNIWQPGRIEDTPLPLYVYAEVPEPHMTRVSLPLMAKAIEAYTYTSDIIPSNSLIRAAELGLPESTMSPDDPFGCVNRAYYACMHPENSEVRDDYRSGTGAWEEVGRYLKFQPGLEMLAMDLLRGLMGLRIGQEVPPYMAVHIRRTDFPDEYRNSSQMHYAHQAWHLLHKVKTHHGIDIKHVVFTTDEEDDEWLDVLRNIGWIHIYHHKARTRERLGWWFPTILDSVILSSAKVFLGVPSSTMSILPYRRVIDWNGGIAKFIKDPTKHHTPPEWEWTTDW